MMSSMAETAHPALDAQRALSCLLDLIRGIRDVGDIDSVRLRRIFGVEFREAGGRLGFGEQVSRDWWTAFEWDPAHPSGPRFEFSFQPAVPGTHPPASAICAMDADAFAASLMAMGFMREARHAEHGRPSHDVFERPGFERPGVVINVHTRGEADEPAEKIAHACVERVHIL